MLHASGLVILGFNRLCPTCRVQDVKLENVLLADEVSKGNGAQRAFAKIADFGLLVVRWSRRLHLDTCADSLCSVLQALDSDRRPVVMRERSHSGSHRGHTSALPGSPALSEGLQRGYTPRERGQHVLDSEKAQTLPRRSAKSHVLPALIDKGGCLYFPLCPSLSHQLCPHSIIHVHQINREGL